MYPGPFPYPTRAAEETASYRDNCPADQRKKRDQRSQRRCTAAYGGVDKCASDHQQRNQPAEAECAGYRTSSVHDSANVWRNKGQYHSHPALWWPPVQEIFLVCGVDGPVRYHEDKQQNNKLRPADAEHRRFVTPYYREGGGCGPQGRCLYRPPPRSAERLYRSPLVLVDCTCRRAFACPGSRRTPLFIAVVATAGRAQRGERHDQHAKSRNRGPSFPVQVASLRTPLAPLSTFCPLMSTTIYNARGPERPEGAISRFHRKCCLFACNLTRICLAPFFRAVGARNAD